MNAVIVICCIMCFCILISMIPVGLDAAFGESGSSLCLKVGLLSFHLMKGSHKQERKKGTDIKKNSKNDRQKLMLTAGQIVQMIRTLLPAAGRIVSHGRFSILHVHFVAGAPDPADAAMLYGAAGLMLDALDSFLRSGKTDKKILADVDFARSSPSIELRLGAVFRFGRLFLEALLTTGRLFFILICGRLAAGTR